MGLALSYYHEQVLFFMCVILFGGFKYKGNVSVVVQLLVPSCQICS